MLTETEKMMVKYGLSLYMTEICDKIERIRNNVKYLTVLQQYKKQLQELNLLMRRFD